MKNDHVITRDEFMIPSDTPDIKLHLINKRRTDLRDFGPERTIVMIHGATYSSASLYDVRLGEYSFMDYLAEQGFEVFAVDVRGYGGSTRPSQMDRPPAENVPLVRTETGIRDFSSAVSFVLRTRNLHQVSVIGMSWGSSVAGAFVSRNPDKVKKVALIAPQWLSDKPIPIDTGGALDAYRIVPVSKSKERWLSAAPIDKRAALLPTGWFEAWSAATIATEPDSAIRDKQSIRATNGAILDIREFWTSGKPLYNPAEIEVPVLLVHGEWDQDVPLDLARAYFAELRGAPYRRWIEIGEATHMMVLEKNRWQVFSAIAGFLIEPNLT